MAPVSKKPHPALNSGQIVVTAYVVSGETVTLTVTDPNGANVPMTSSVNGNEYSATSNQTLVPGTYNGTYVISVPNDPNLQKAEYNFQVVVS